jgi:hypothetical protein
MVSDDLDGEDNSEFEPKPESAQGPTWWHGEWPAGGIRSKQDMVPYLRSRLDDLRSALWSGEAVVREIATEFAVQAVGNAHAALARFGGKKLPRPSQDQLQNTGGVESALEDILSAISSGWGKDEFAASRGTKDSGTQPGEPTGSAGILLHVNRWDDLGLGIGEDGYWAITPCPELGGIFTRSEATKLRLAGRRWLDVLSWFSKSENGRTAKRSDLAYALRFAQRGTVSKESAEYDDRLQEQKTGLKKLTNAMSDLGREMRELVATEDKTKVFQVVSRTDYVAAFTIRCLWRDDGGRLRFGQKF